MSSDLPFSVLIVDDSALVRGAFKAMLKAEFPLATIVAVNSSAEAMAEARLRSYDIALVDIELGDSSGLDLISELRTLTRPPLMIAVSMNQESIFVTRSMQSGASSYVAKGTPWGELFEAIRKTLEGQSYISLGLAK
jgi:DNA-binding NarL/FixJ family response regulator